MRDRVVEAEFGIIEDFFFGLGDADEFLVREQDRMLDLVDSLERGVITPSSARMAIRLDFSACQQELDTWRRKLSGDATKFSYPYLHPSLKVARVLAPLPEGAA